MLYISVKYSEESCIQYIKNINFYSRLIEADAKSLSNLTSLTHSRKNSDTSQISYNSGELF